VQALWRCNRGQVSLQVIGGEQLRQRPNSPVADLGWNSRACRPCIGESELGDGPGAQAELLRRLAGTRVQQGGGFMAAQGLCAAEQGEAGGAMVCGGCGGEVRCREGLGCVLRRGAGDLGVRALEGRPASITGSRCARRGCGGDGANQRASAVSEPRRARRAEERADMRGQHASASAG